MPSQIHDEVDAVWPPAPTSPQPVRRRRRRRPIVAIVLACIVGLPTAAYGTWLFVWSQHHGCERYTLGELFGAIGIAAGAGWGLGRLFEYLASVAQYFRSR